MEAGTHCNEHIHYTPPQSFPFFSVAFLCTTTATAQAGSAVPTGSGCCRHFHIFRFCTTCYCFWGHFVRGHFGSEVYCGSSMASASSASLHGGEPCPTLTLKPFSHRGSLARTEPQTPRKVNQTQRRCEQQDSYASASVCVCSALLVLDHMKWTRRAAALGLFGLLRRLRHERAGCSSGGEWPLSPEGTAQGCRAGDAQRGPRCCRSGECKQALSRHTSVSAFFFLRFVQHPRLGRRLRRCAWVVLLHGAIIVAAGSCGVHKLALHTPLVIFFPLVSSYSPGVTLPAALGLGCSRGCAASRSSAPSRTRAARAALGHRGCRSPLGELARHT